LTSFRLRFDPTEIEYWAGRYTYRGEYKVESEVGPRVRAQGYLTKADFLTLCHWKSPRTAKLCSTNPEDYIKTVTQTALRTAHERLRIEVLTLLRGVSWPTASVILHFGALAPYPILDYRALWSLGVETPGRYDFRFWWRYTVYCRELAARFSVSMRMLDRALWQFSKENQP